MSRSLAYRYLRVSAALNPAGLPVMEPRTGIHFLDLASLFFYDVEHNTLYGEGFRTVMVIRVSSVCTAGAAGPRSWPEILVISLKCPAPSGELLSKVMSSVDIFSSNNHQLLCVTVSISSR
jgi:hypothetical protein